ncbi:MAG: Alpha/beta knot methyltransferase [Olpidium bornovanus]|uniref:16S rRNA (uracil(1498)-N(3))-methyltransferase n=1 Tax=Olpidium bornovanus TaxID=278681 RepID=A0A8H8DMH1_9FUNG|nr:MAG: Alpha/beta knot methyltransferase [Olpidium bornovanus]
MPGTLLMPKRNQQQKQQQQKSAPVVFFCVIFRNPPGFCALRRVPVSRSAARRHRPPVLLPSLTSNRAPSPVGPLPPLASSGVKAGETFTAAAWRSRLRTPIFVDRHLLHNGLLPRRRTPADSNPSPFPPLLLLFTAPAMNLIILSKADFVSETTARLPAGERRYEHVAEVLKPGRGDTVSVGLIGGRVGTARVTVPPPPPLAVRKFKAGKGTVAPTGTRTCTAAGEGREEEEEEKEDEAAVVVSRTGGGDDDGSAEGAAVPAAGGGAPDGGDRQGNPGYVELEILELRSEPPPKLPLTLLLALPRPKVLHRVLQAVSSLGVPRLVLVAAARVERSYWSATKLRPAEVREQLLLGLEQARDTVLPQLVMLDTWDAVVGRLAGLDGAVDPDSWFAAATKLVAHPPDADDDGPAAPGGVSSDDSVATCPRGLPLSRNAVLAIGPEGGWVPEEVAFLRSIGFRCVSLGKRILRTETAIPVLIGRLF